MSVNVYDPVNDTLTPIAGATLYADTPVGFIGAFDAEEVPDGWLIFNGQTVLRSDYPDLWARANRNNQVGVGKFYGIGDGSTTFTLADLRETSLKGYGETSRSVGAHVKSGGLAVGEFLDDRLQDHRHRIASTINTTGASDYTTEGESSGTHSYIRTELVMSDAGFRLGATTEVKAVGVVWAVKARMAGLPIDLAQQVDAKINEKIYNPSSLTVCLVPGLNANSESVMVYTFPFVGRWTVSSIKQMADGTERKSEFNIAFDATNNRMVMYALSSAYVGKIYQIVFTKSS